MGNYYDCKKCLHEKVCDLWSKHECQDASSFQLDGCDYYQDKSRYICVDDAKGPGPDPEGTQGEPGQEGSIFQDLMDIFDGYMALKRAKEAEQCEELDMPGLVCTEELCDCFSTRCENNCTKYLDVRDCKQVDPDSPEARP